METKYSDSMDEEAIDAFKCCDIEYWYPAGKTVWEDDESIKPVIRKMRVTIGSKVERVFVPVGGRPDVTPYMEALVVPPSDFFMPWQPQEEYGEDYNILVPY